MCYSRSPLVLGTRLRGRLIDKPSAKALVSYFSCTFYFPWTPSLVLGICSASTLVVGICCSKWESPFAYKGQGSVTVKLGHCIFPFNPSGQGLNCPLVVSDLNLRSNWANTFSRSCLVLFFESMSNVSMPFVFRINYTAGP